jgi:uncharacterized protein (DUF2147 family)
MQKSILSFLFIMWSLVVFGQINSDPILGKWKSEHGDRTIEFIQKDNHFDAIVRDATDKTIIGKNQIVGLEKSKDNNYANGEIIIIKNVKKGNCSAILVNVNELDISGKMGFLSRTTKWFRVKP